MQISPCPVCGWELGESFDETALRNSFLICKCCGCEYGCDDTSAYREASIAKGMPWFKTKKQPQVWNREEQLRNIVLDWNQL